MTAKFVIGVDLGTTNSVLAYSPLGGDMSEVRVLPIPQLVAAGTVESRTALPSFLYVAAEHERAAGLFDLPWAKQRGYVVGELARRRAAEAPERTLGAAKSWLSHSRVDRRQAILPWNAPAEVERVSPVTASQRYLEHLMAAWKEAYPQAPFCQQRVVLTVPASFDPVARELTREAALAAGFPDDFVLLEEPQAALYAWLATHGDRWRKLLRVGETILVCDVGGGTTDLTLIRVIEDEGTLALQRVAVGDHLLVGGDNMDLTLAHLVASQFAQQGVKLDPWQSVSLWHSCRTAKESLLQSGGRETETISVLGRGSKLIGGTVSVEVQRQAIGNVLADGFFPYCELHDRPRKQRASGFQELGLPYESDPALSRHLAAFLSAHAASLSQAALLQTFSGAHEGAADAGHAAPHGTLPSHVLFNGGVFKSELLRNRLLDLLQRWSGEQVATRPLEGEPDLDHAVARGAAHYGWTKEHGGVRIRGGTARSYYVGIETAGLAIPGAPRPLRALCVVPFGMEEGTQNDVPSGEIGLVLGEPAQFRFFSSTTRKLDPPGTLLDQWHEDELIEASPLETTLPADQSDHDYYVPVRFQSRITELGMFELWCVATNSNQRWKLEFNVREQEEVNR